MERREVEDKVKEIVSEVGGTKTTSEIAKTLHRKDPSVTETEVRRAVWRLIDRGVLDLTPQRTIDFRRAGV